MKELKLKSALHFSNKFVLAGLNIQNTFIQP